MDTGTTDTAKMTDADDLTLPLPHNDVRKTEEAIAEEVQDLVGEISKHFVPRPSNEQ